MALYYDYSWTKFSEWICFGHAFGKGFLQVCPQDFWTKTEKLHFDLLRIDFSKYFYRIEMGILMKL